MKSKQSLWQKLTRLAMRTISKEISCRELGGFMVDYLDGTLPQGQRRQFDSHLHGCPDCVRYLESYERTVALSQAACRDPDTPAATDVPEELVQAILTARNKKT